MDGVDIKLLMLYAATGTVLGHDFPVYLGFKGGKGIACSAALLFSAAPEILAPVAGIFFATLFITKYVSMDFAENYTRVYFDDQAYVSKDKNDRTPMTVMGIHTKEFGEVTGLQSGLNPSSYHELLNELKRFCV